MSDAILALCGIVFIAVLIQGERSRHKRHKETQK
jgi:hypothetical protein